MKLTSSRKFKFNFKLFYRRFHSTCIVFNFKLHLFNVLSNLSKLFPFPEKNWYPWISLVKTLPKNIFHKKQVWLSLSSAYSLKCCRYVNSKAILKLQKVSACPVYQFDLRPYIIKNQIQNCMRAFNSSITHKTH